MVSCKQSVKRNMVARICVCHGSLEGEIAGEAKETMAKGTERKEIQGSREVVIMGTK